MIALTEHGYISLANAILAAGAVVLVAWIGRRQRVNREETRQENEKLTAAVQATNGHETLGEGVAAIEERLIALDQKLDAALEEATEFRRETQDRLESLEDVATKPPPQVKKPKGGTT
jgi:hypothetical protein